MTVPRFDRTTGDESIQYAPPDAHEAVAVLDDVDLVIANPVPKRPGTDSQVACGLDHIQKLIRRHLLLLVLSRLLAWF
jgi:hypothetical protein